MSRSIAPDLFAALARLRPLVDAVLLVVAALAASTTLAYIRGQDSLNYLATPEHQAAILIALCLLPLTLSQYGAYRSQRDVPVTAELVRLWSAIGFVVLLLILLSAISKTTTQVSRLWAGLWAGYTVLLLTVLRLFARYLLRRLRISGYDTRRIVIVGSGELAAKVVMHLAMNSTAGYRLIGYLADEPSWDRIFSAVPYLGRLEDAQRLCIQHRLVADQVWVTVGESRPDELRKVLDQISQLPHDIRLVPDGLLATLCEMPVATVAGLPTIELAGFHVSGAGRLIKEIEDRVLAALMLVLLVPVMLVIVLLIRLDSPGPALFRQKRHGWGGEEIVVLKFRTMRSHDETQGVVTQAQRDDPRVTRVGRWLRRSSLDELPQILNVLSGSMSLVGPRPHAAEHNEFYANIIRNYMHRHRVKPGITGWAQVNGFRGETDTPEKMQRRVEYDLYYIENWSLGFDLVILILTLVRGLTSPQAY